MADMKALVDHLGILLNQLSDKEKRKLSMEIGRKLRRSQSSRISNQKNPDGSPYQPRKKQKIRDKKGHIKNKMFTRIKMARFMKVKQEPNGASVGFLGNVAFIAQVHQLGLRDRVHRRKNSPVVKYPARELLGFTSEEIEMIENDVLSHFSKIS
ncbi:phage virion morphogenesis protein [Acinetobacter baumannii]|uniref:Phage virion morphogenesis protein n=2 Tax=Acinetobacter baumannii TaxID=470 RepID=A0A1S2G3A4_ACIBA|nr:phage virion morphogenesis protein [Acinetobacter baumannii]EHU2312626.1 phage virion morphogenesis protein [Acinetobacter baumannii]MBD0161927.1 phage virion morphogenesis protein [Acinetobacter baumannii]MCE6436513.1 phage virion morphogenesis protein [Acinetobacter baumannii]MCE6824067.1 phage virion morphogenesis protein [Acinetobacter baumannii]MCE6827834.1 phage virion morphogenesis protein [Acinetobacter baumannii]